MPAILLRDSVIVLVGAWRIRGLTLKHGAGNLESCAGLGIFDAYVPTTRACDMVKVFTLIAMEPPIRVSGTGSADYVRDAKVTPVIGVLFHKCVSAGLRGCVP